MRIFSFIFLSAAILCFLGGVWQQQHQSTGQGKGEVAGARREATPVSSPTAIEIAVGNEVTVTRIVDGDTIEVEGGRNVRYIGIDTPETRKPGFPVECYGQEASVENKRLVDGKKIRMVKDVSETDRYGRLLRYVYAGDVFINLELVKNGFASAATFPPDVAKQEELLAAEREARTAKRGMWGECENNKRISE